LESNEEERTLRTTVEPLDIHPAAQPLGIHPTSSVFFRRDMVREINL